MAVGPMLGINASPLPSAHQPTLTSLSLVLLPTATSKLPGPSIPSSVSVTPVGPLTHAELISTVNTSVNVTAGCILITLHPGQTPLFLIHTKLLMQLSAAFTMLSLVSTLVSRPGLRAARLKLLGRCKLLCLPALRRLTGS